jgi:hypothetical protein
VLAGELAIAYFEAHAPLSPAATANDGIPAITCCLYEPYLMLAERGA